jgi:hypothetical protein
MSIQEDRAAFGQPVDVGSSRLRMATKTANPVVLIIDCDHQNIGPEVVRCFACRERAKSDGQGRTEHIGPDNMGRNANAIQEDGSSRNKLGWEIVILAIAGKK